MREQKTRCFLIKARLNSMFVSVQGEGPWLGTRQVFLRFAGCNLNCDYCDTDFSEKIICDYKAVLDFVVENMPVHSVSLTGGEPLLQVDFLAQFLPALKEIKQTDVYLETNATLAPEFSKISAYVDYVAADIKLPSVARIEPVWEQHREFFSAVGSRDSNGVIKIVVNRNIADEDIAELESILWEFGQLWVVVLQPEFSLSRDKEFLGHLMNMQKRFLKLAKDVRIIPQVHRLIGIE